MKLFTTFLVFEHNVFLLIALAVIIIVHFLTRPDQKVSRCLEAFGGPLSFPVVGTALSFRIGHEEIIPLFSKWQIEFGKVFRFWVANTGYLFVADPDVVQLIVSGKHNLSKGDTYKNLSPWIGTGLLTAPGEKWFKRREAINPSFHPSILKEFVTVFNKQASTFLNCLEKDRHCSGMTLDIMPYLTRLSLDIICETAMGYSINCQTGYNADYLDAVNGMCTISLDMALKPWLKLDIPFTKFANQKKVCLATLKKFTMNIIKSRREERKMENRDLREGGKGQKPLLDFLLDNNWADADIKEEVDTFMFAGHDTVAMNLGFTILLLAMNPECQEKVYKELNSILDGNYDQDLGMEDISKMKYLECCIKESLRLFPSVPYISRKIDKEIQISSGKVIPIGATVMIALFNMQRDPDNFAGPLKFHPERWMDGSLENLNSFAYLPFSKGPRSCIGQTFSRILEKIILAKFVQKYVVTTSEVIDKLPLVPATVLKSNSGIKIQLYRRDRKGSW